MNVWLADPAALVAVRVNEYLPLSALAAFSVAVPPLSVSVSHDGSPEPEIVGVGVPDAVTENVKAPGPVVAELALVNTGELEAETVRVNFCSVVPPPFVATRTK